MSRQLYSWLRKAAVEGLDPRAVAAQLYVDHRRSPSEIARSFHVSVDTVTAWLVEMGVTLRRQGGHGSPIYGGPRCIRCEMPVGAWGDTCAMCRAMECQAAEDPEPRLVEMRNPAFLNVREMEVV